MNNSTFLQNEWWYSKGRLNVQFNYVLYEDYFSETWKEKVIQDSNRQKDSLHETKGSSSIQCHKNCYVTYTSNDHINR